MHLKYCLVEGKCERQQQKSRISRIINTRRKVKNKAIRISVLISSRLLFGILRRKTLPSVVMSLVVYAFVVDISTFFLPEVLSVVGALVCVDFTREFSLCFVVDVFTFCFLEVEAL